MKANLVLKKMICSIFIFILGIALAMIFTVQAHAEEKEPDGGSFGVIYYYVNDQLQKYDLNSDRDVEERIEYFNHARIDARAKIIYKLNHDWTTNHFITNSNNDIEIRLNGYSWKVTGRDRLETSEDVTIEGGNGTMTFTGGISEIFKVKNDSLTVKDVTFAGCNCGNYGVFSIERRGLLKTAWYYFDNVVFDNCKAGYGGAIYFNVNYVSHIEVPILGEANVFKNCTFRNCRARRGGAIYCAPGWDSGKNTLKFENCQFIDDYADDYGGAIYVDQKENTYDFRDCSFYGCSTNNRGYGGAIYVWSNYDTFNFSNTPITNCTASYGGAFYLDGTETSIDGNSGDHHSVISNCRARNEGGAIFTSDVLNHARRVVIRNMDFISNTAGEAHDKGRLKSSGNRNQCGGALSLEAKSPTIENCNFYDNYCGYDGGAVYIGSLAYRYVDIHGCTFDSDWSVRDGSEIWSYWYSTGNSKINDCTFWVNTGNPFSKHAEHIINMGRNNVIRSREPEPDIWDGDGTVGNPYIISNREDLYKLADSVYQGFTYQGKYFALNADITTPFDSCIGSVTHPFRGTFDGRNHTVKLGIVGDRCTGLFGNIWGADVRNIRVNGNVRGTVYSGGIFGYSEASRITNCVNEASVTADNAIVGGIGGSSRYDTIDGCRNNGNVIGSYMFGTAGIVGEVREIQGGGRTTIKNCINNGTVRNLTNNDVGGIVGKGNDADIQECTNNGAINCSGYNVGGIVGFVVRNMEIRQCVNNGTVSSRNAHSRRSNDGRHGGIAGCLGNNSIVENSVNHGDVFARFEGAGLVAAMFNSKVVNSASQGKLNGAASTVLVGIGSVDNCFATRNESEAHDAAVKLNDYIRNNLPRTQGWYKWIVDSNGLLQLRNGEVYLVTFNANYEGGDTVMKEVLKGQPVSEPAEITRPGFKNIGWYTDSACTDSNKWNMSNPVQEDMNLFAKWQCEHKEMKLIKGQAPTEEEDGWKDCYYCDNCKLYFEDRAGQKEIGDESDYILWKTFGDGVIGKILSTYLAPNQNGELIEIKIPTRNITKVDGHTRQFGERNRTKWYLVDRNITIDHSCEIAGNVHLIIKKDCTLTIQGTLTINSGSTLSVYGQTIDEGVGKLIVRNKDRNSSAINSGRKNSNSDSPRLNIYSATLAALSAGTESPGIDTQIELNVNSSIYQMYAGDDENSAELQLIWIFGRTYRYIRFEPVDYNNAVGSNQNLNDVEMMRKYMTAEDNPAGASVDNVGNTGEQSLEGTESTEVTEIPPSETDNNPEEIINPSGEAQDEEIDNSEKSMKRAQSARYRK